MSRIAVIVHRPQIAAYEEARPADGTVHIGGGHYGYPTPRKETGDVSEEPDGALQVLNHLDRQH